MRLTCFRDDLRKALAIVGRAVAPRSTLPILLHFKLEAMGEELSVSATNLELGIVHSIQADIDEEGSICIPARLAQEFFKNLSGEEIAMRVVRGQKLEVVCGKHKANIKGIDAADMPDFLPAGAAPSVQINSELLRRMIEQTAFSAAQDDSRPSLAGISMRLDGTALVMASTDGYRLSERSGELASEAEQGAVIVPARSMVEVSRAISQGQQDTVGLMFDRNKMVAFVDGTVIVSQLVGSPYPDYTSIIPKTATTRVVVDTAALSKAVIVTRLFTYESNIVLFTIDPGAEQILISAASADVGDNEARVDAKIEGDGMEIAFSSTYLIEALSAMGHGNTIMELTNPLSPGLLRPDGIEETVYRHVIMPMRKS